MTYMQTERCFPSNLRQGVERVNYHYLRGLEELKRRRRPGGITSKQFEEIRSFSRQSWKSECEEQDPFKSRFQTTYSSYHQFRKESTHDGEEYRSKSRPVSPTRRNNPHPSRQFITLHIKEAPGFQYKNGTQVKLPYQVGKRYEKEHINDEKRLYYSTPIKDEIKKWEMQNIKKQDENVSISRWVKKAGIEEEERAKLLKLKLSKEQIMPPEVNAKYIGKLDPNRYVLGRY